MNARRRKYIPLIIFVPIKNTQYITDIDKVNQMAVGLTRLPNALIKLKTARAQTNVHAVFAN
jgi:hypothetical protein